MVNGIQVAFLVITPQVDDQKTDLVKGTLESC